MAIYTAEELAAGVLITEELNGETDFNFIFPDLSGSTDALGGLEIQPYGQTTNYFFRRAVNTNDPGDIVVGTAPASTFGTSNSSPGFIFAAIEDNQVDQRGIFGTFTTNPTITEGGTIVIEDVTVYQTGGSTTDSGARCKITFDANTVVQITIEQEAGMLSDYTAGTIQWTQAQVNAFPGVSGATSGLQFTLPATSLYRLYGVDSPGAAEVPFVGGSGTGALATQIQVSNNICEYVRVQNGDRGTGYKVGDIISIPATAVGGTGTALSFELVASTIETVPLLTPPNVISYFTFESLRNPLTQTYSGSIGYANGVKAVSATSLIKIKPNTKNEKFTLNNQNISVNNITTNGGTNENDLIDTDMVSENDGPMLVGATKGTVIKLFTTNQPTAELIKVSVVQGSNGYATGDIITIAQGDLQALGFTNANGNLVITVGSILYDNNNSIFDTTDDFIWSANLQNGGSKDNNVIEWTPSIVVPVGSAKLYAGGEVALEVV